MNNNNKRLRQTTISAIVTISVIIMSISLVPLIATAEIDHEYFRFVATTSRSPSAILNFVTDNIGTGNAKGLDPGDMFVFHLNINQNLDDDNIQSYVDMLHQIPNVDPSNIFIEVFSLEQIEHNAPIVAEEGFGGISYDLEGTSPDEEEDDPVASFEQARNATDSAGIELQAAPGRAITNSDGTGIAPLVDYYHIQSQTLQNDDSSCTTMKNFVTSTVTALQRANDGLNGHISYQLSFAQDAAPGKTVYQTMVDCARATTPTLVDGMSPWYNTAAFTNTGPDGLKAFSTFWENKYSRNNPN